MTATSTSSAGVGGWRRWRWRGWTAAIAASITALVVAVLGLPAVGVPAAGGSGSAPAQGQPVPEAGPPDVLPAGGRWTVTLLTGQVVSVTSDAEGRASASVRSRSGPTRVIREPDGDVLVVPMDVTRLYDDVLDSELFNVTALVRQGYDDEASPVIPVIVGGNPAPEVRSTLAAGDQRALPSIGATAMEVPKGNARATGDLLERLLPPPGDDVRSVGGVAKVWLDGRVRAESVSAPARAANPAATRQQQPIDGNLTQVGADRAWAAGLTGEGTRVGVLDTGIDPTHPDLAGQIAAQENFSDSEDAIDRNGHGTHVASLVAGTGAAAGGARSGVAAGADLIVGKVLDDSGSGPESDIIAGMEWAAGAGAADVVNMSLSSFEPSDGDDPMSIAVDRLSDEHGTLFVVSSGNDGPLSQTIGSPSAADRALTVGAVDDRDALAEFSGRGPVRTSYELKPEVLAPGVDIVAARAAGTDLGGEPVGDLYITASGTSMAAPHAAGVAAVLAQQHPDWSGDQLKNAIIGSTTPIEGDGYAVGAGRVDVGDGIAAPLLPGRDAVEAFLPDPRTEPHAETLEWLNTGAEAVTVTLDAGLEDRDGEPADEVTVEPARLTIAPGETASARVVVDGPDLDPGLYSGAITATGPGEVTARTPVALRAAPRDVELTIAATTPEPTPGLPPFAWFHIINLDDFAEFNLIDWFEGDTFTVRVPAGRYAVTGDVLTQDDDMSVAAQVGDPDVNLTEDTTVRFDGRAAVPLTPEVAGADTVSWDNWTSVLTTPARGTGGYPFESIIVSSHPYPPVRVTPMEGAPEVFASRQGYRLQAPHLTARAGRDPIEEVKDVPHVTAPAEGTHTFAAVDAGNGTDFSRARGRLAVVALPADGAERTAIAERAAAAGVGVLAFVDEQRPFLTVWRSSQWADVPVIAAGGRSASRLRAAAAAGRDVTVTVSGSPYVYDVMTPWSDHVDPDPEIDRDERARMARIDERFTRDADGTGAAGDWRYPDGAVIQFGSEGPLPARRTAYVTPGVPWESAVYDLFDLDGSGDPGFFFPIEYSSTGPEAYAAGTRRTETWLRRPQWPAPVDAPANRYCRRPPVTRSADTLHVALEPFQDGPGRTSCMSAERASLVLERDGTQIGTSDSMWLEADFAVPPEAGTYRLTLDHEGRAPYAHRSTTAWTFRSSAGGAEDAQRVPLLVVEYRLPLDTLNRPDGDTATLAIHTVAGADPQPIRQVRVWTSTDDGASWQRATVRRQEAGRYELGMPDVPRGAGVSLRVDAADGAGGRIEQTLYDAYTR
jgi:subtilisin family serine protease